MTQADATDTPAGNRRPWKLLHLRAAALLGFLLLVAASVALTLWALQAQRTDALVISLAGRQRMLLQLMTLETLDIRLTGSAARRGTLHGTAHAFDDTLNALSAGGQAPHGDGGSVTLPPTQAPEILAQLQIVEATWEEMHAAIHAVLDEDPQSAAFAEAADAVQRLSPTLAVQTDEVARMYQAQADRHVQRVQTIQLIFLAASTGLVVGVLFASERHLLRPVAGLEEAARRIGAGDLASAVSPVGLGEIRSLAHSLDQMRRSLGASAEAQRSLLELSRGLLAARDEGDVLECAVKVAASALKTEFSALVLPDAGGRLLARAVRGWPEDFPRDFELGRGDASQTGYTILRGHAVAVDDYATQTEFSVPPTVFDHGIASGLSVPMVLEGRVVGAMLVHSRSRRRFQDFEVQVLSSIANQTAIALDRAQLSEAERRRAQESETLRQAGAAVAATLDQSEALERILQQLARVVPYDSASVQLLVEDPAWSGQGYLEIVGGRGWPDPAVVVGLRFPVPGDNPNTVVLQQRRAHIVNDAPSAYAGFRQPPHDHVRSFLGVPLVVQERVIGMLAVDSACPGHFTSDHAQLVTAFADQVAVALENARLFESERRTREAAAALLDITQVASSSLELTQVLKQISQRSAQACQANRCTIFLLDEAEELLQPVMSQFADGHPDRKQWEAFKATTADSVEAVPLFRTVIRDRRPAILYDPARTDLVPAKWTHPFGIQKILSVPLISRDRVIGLMSLDHTDPSRQFTPEQVELARTIGGQVTGAIVNARLHARVQELATIDELTGLTNRRHLLALAAREFERARRYARPLSAVLLDIDHFKRVNDALGHAVGDEVLRAVAQRCQRNVRSVDVIGRYGGEEFVVILPESPLGAASHGAERLRRSVSAEPVGTQRGVLEVTISLGVAGLSEDCPDLPTLIERADTAMYAAKRAGRNCVRLFGQAGGDQR